MALSNRDRVGRAFELLATGLGPYVDRRMRAASRAGKDWLRDYLASASPPIRGESSVQDPALLLRIMADGWERAFGTELGRSDRNLVFELRDVRNRWAHNDAFTIDDAYRALDSIERLLTAADAREAIEVGTAKAELMRIKFEAQARKATPSAEALLTQPAAGLRPWREVIQPHDDVARGRFSLAEFAADLHQVAMGDGADEYADPVEFFRRTFLTGGLRQLLGQAVERLTGGGGSPVVDLQTSFGGGKTHSMIALYHLCSGEPLDRFPQEVQDLVSGVGAKALPSVRRAVLVGHRIPPGQATVKPDATVVQTLWGELAWQLGGAEGFALLAEADRTSSNPGDTLRTLLERAGPCLILIDEWVAYARALYNDDSLRGGTFDTHFSFAQVLTEAVRAAERALLVVSIPASEATDGSSVGSDVELGGAGGREALRRLRSVIGRVESSWRPATAEESFEIVRRRLFQPVETARLADRDATARVVGDMYRTQASEFPVECREAAYMEKIKRAYPIHPELFARLYEDWSTLDRFQRTRGVLRLMATVIHALWAGQDQSPLILPASVPLSDPAVVAELTRNLEDNWKPIIDADVDGAGSLPRALDDEFKNLGRYGAARRVARAVFLGSAPVSGSPNQGLDAARVRLGCALPGETVAIYGDALNRLADRATYFYAGSGRYWYGTQPGVARLARDRAERLLTGARHEVHEAIGVRLKAQESHRGDFAAVHAVPLGPADVSDEPSARLVILGPDTPHRARAEATPALQLAQQVLDQRGSAPRDFRNMLVFLAADDRRVEDLEQAVAEHLGWASVVSEADSLGLSVQQHQQAQARATEAGSTVDLRLADAYQWLLVPRQPEPTGPIVWDEVKSDGQGHLPERAARKLTQTGGLYVTYPPVLLRLHLDGPLAPLWEAGSVTVNQVWEAYGRYLYLHRLRDVGVLLACVAGGPASTVWATEGFAVAEATDPREPGRFAGLVAGGMAADARGTTLLVQPAVAEAQLAEDRSVEVPTDDEDGAGAVAAAGGGDMAAVGSSTTVARRFYGVVAADPDRLGRDAGRIAQEIVAHLQGLVGTDTEVTIEIRATNAEGFSDTVVKIVSENASALRFKDHGFESV
ncbi:MAG TPA: Swt1 family HEPN domain-containing protein [Acidimicrobiales bacterium]|nr:Swt1 family HEPN domain-containing protein [Acidimicrobiales bacterium]